MAVSPLLAQAVELAERFAGLSRDLEAQAAAAERRELELLAIIDDLSVRILGATLEIGKVAHADVELETIEHGTYVQTVYAADDVDRLLETARHALDAAEQTARYATGNRRFSATRLRAAGRTATIDAHSAAGALLRIASILGNLSARDSHRDLLVAIVHAEELATGTLDELTPDEEPTP